jgi:hypothetical protein
MLCNACGTRYRRTRKLERIGDSIQRQRPYLRRRITAGKTTPVRMKSLGALELYPPVVTVVSLGKEDVDSCDGPCYIRGRHTPRNVNKLFGQERLTLHQVPVVTCAA